VLEGTKWQNTGAEMSEGVGEANKTIQAMACHAIRQSLHRMRTNILLNGAKFQQTVQREGRGGVPNNIKPMEKILLT